MRASLRENRHMQNHLFRNWMTKQFQPLPSTLPTLAPATHSSPKPSTSAEASNTTADWIRRHQTGGEPLTTSAAIIGQEKPLKQSSNFTTGTTSSQLTNSSSELQKAKGIPINDQAPTQRCLAYPNLMLSILLLSLGLCLVGPVKLRQNT